MVLERKVFTELKTVTLDYSLATVKTANAQDEEKSKVAMLSQ